MRDSEIGLMLSVGTSRYLKEQRLETTSATALSIYLIRRRVTEEFDDVASLDDVASSGNVASSADVAFFG